MYKRFLVLVLLLTLPAFGAYVPDGGWTYIYEGDQVIYGASNNNDSLDGSWDHDNSADEWDGSGIWAGAPGGVSALLDGDTTYIRIQDTGHPGKYGIPSPTNRKLYLTHVADEVPEPAGILNSGKFIFGFRARIATGDPLDDVYPADGSGIVPWPIEGKGYMGSDRGKGMFTMGQAAAYRIGEMISFSIANIDPVAYGDEPRGILTMNGASGSVVGKNNSVKNEPPEVYDCTDCICEPDPYDGEGILNAMIFKNPQNWHEFLITVDDDLQGVCGDGWTHKVTVVIDPDENGVGYTQTFNVTAGIDANPQADEYPVNFIGIGLGATSPWGAYDIDYVAYQIPEPVTIALLGLGGLALLRRRK